MDLAALIFAPFVLALLYSRTWMGRLPRMVLVGLPVALMALLFVALWSYIPAIQEAIMTQTPLIRTFDWRIFALHLDGLSLLFGLIITGLGAITSAIVAQKEDHQRLIRDVMFLMTLLLGLVLVDHVAIFFTFWILLIVALFLFIRPHLREDKRAWAGFTIALLGGIALLIGLMVMSQAGAHVKALEQPIYDISQISTANLSRTEAYPLYAVLLLSVALSASVQFALRRHYTSPAILAFLASITILSSTYLLVRFYPSMHDNPLWWTVVTGVGLLLMLVGALWTLCQREATTILVCLVLSIIGACIALLGLPDYLGVKAAVLTITVYALVFPILFLSVGRVHTLKSGFAAVLVLAGLALGLVDVWTIQAFYVSTLRGAGIALAIVVLSMALITMNLLRVLRDMIFVGTWPAMSPAMSTQQIEFQQERTRQAFSLQMILGVLALVVLVCALLFDGLIAPLLPMLIPQGTALDIPAVMLTLLAWAGGTMLYATRATWLPLVSVARTQPDTALIDSVG